MENQSLTQQKSNNLVNRIKENLNYIYIVLMIIVNILLGILVVKDGEIGLTYPSTLLGWILWILQILINTFIGVAILQAFRRQGVKLGHDKIKETYQKYLDAIRQNTESRPRSLKEYISKEGTKDALSKSIIYVIIGLFTGSVLIGYNLNNLLSLLINTIFAIGFGIKALLEAEEFVITELVVWYQLKTAEVTDHKKEPAKEDNKK